MTRWLLLLALLFTGITHADTDGPAYAGTAASTDQGGGDEVAWTSPSNATGSSTATNTSATVNADSGPNPTQALVLTNYTFSSLEVGDTVTQIDVTIYRSSSGSGRATDQTIKLVVGGALTGNNKASGTQWPTSNSPPTGASGASYTWNTGAGDSMPSAAQVLASNFGVAIQATETNDDDETARIYYAAITITYTPSGGEGEGEGEGETESAMFLLLD